MKRAFANQVTSEIGERAGGRKSWVADAAGAISARTDVLNAQGNVPTPDRAR